MKILFTIFDIQDYGGIVADLELKCKGLREAGHSVTVVLLRNGDSEPTYRRTNLEGGPAGSYNSEFGTYQKRQILANAKSGWYNIRVLSYGTKDRMSEWQEFASRFDFVIHEIPGPTLPDPNGHWMGLYEIDPPQIVSAHDAHFRDMYPHLIYVADKINGITCTNPAGYRALEWFPGPRAFVGAPHPVLDWDSLPDWKVRSARGVAAHVWKAWKRQDMIVRAVPLLQRSVMIMAGDGIERHYMTSTKKVKPAYRGIWRAAERSEKMKFVGLLSPDRLFAAYQGSRVMVDMSLSEKFIALGNHFNRSIIEGYNNGVLPICVRGNMSEKGMQVQMFKAGKTHFELKNSATHVELAELIDHVANLKAAEAAEMVDAGRQILLKYFDYRKCSLDYLKLAKGKPAGVYPELEIGETCKAVRVAAKMKVQGYSLPNIKSAIRRIENAGV